MLPQAVLEQNVPDIQPVIEALKETLDSFIPDTMQDIATYQLCVDPVITPQGKIHSRSTLNNHWDQEKKHNQQREDDGKEIKRTTCPRTRASLQEKDLIKLEEVSQLFKIANEKRNQLLTKIDALKEGSSEVSIRAEMKKFHEELIDFDTQIKKLIAQHNEKNAAKITIQKIKDKFKLNRTAENLTFWSDQHTASCFPVALDPRITLIRGDNGIDYPVFKQVAEMITAADQKADSKEAYIDAFQKARAAQLAPKWYRSWCCCFNFNVTAPVESLLKEPIDSPALFERKR